MCKILLARNSAGTEKGNFLRPPGYFFNCVFEVELSVVIRKEAVSLANRAGPVDN